MFGCFKKRKLKKEIEQRSDFFPERTVCLIVPHEARKPGAWSPQLGASEYKYMELFLNGPLSDEFRQKDVDCHVIYRDGVGISGAYKKALSLKPALIMEWHFNAYNGKANGFEILYKPDLQKEKDLANDILDVFKHVLGSKNRGLKVISKKGERGFYNVSQTSKIPSILLEPFFGDNKKDAANFDEKKLDVAKAVVQACLKYLD